MSDDEKAKRSEDAEIQRRGRWVLAMMVLVCVGYGVFVSARLLTSQPKSAPESDIAYTAQILTIDPATGFQTCDNELVVVNTLTGANLTGMALSETGHISGWLPDGEQVMYASGNAVYVAKIGENQSRLMLNLPDGTIYASLSPDGQWITYYFFTSPSEAELWMMKPDGTQNHRLDNSGFIWSPDGTQWALADEVIDIRTGERQPTGEHLSHSGLAWSPDNKQIAYIAPSGDSLMIYDIATRQTHTIEVDKPVNAVAWSPEGQTLAVWQRGNSESAYILLVDLSGKTQLELDSHALGIVDARWSPDGRQLAFTSFAEPYGCPGYPLYVFNLDTGRYTRLSAEDTFVRSFMWRPG